MAKDEEEDLKAAEEQIEEQLEHKPEDLERVALDALDKRAEEDKGKEDESAKSEEKPEAKEKGDEKEEGYYADEAEEEPDSNDVPEKVRDEWKNLSPLERYLAENIPPLTIRGQMNGKNASLQVYDITNIPDAFEFNSRGEERQALISLSRMERKAEQLQSQFESKEQQASIEKFQAQERADIRSDIAKLQREGEIPLGTPNTSPDDDPKLQIARDILAYYEEQNAKRLEEANSSGRLFNRLSYYDAYRLWKIDNAKVGKEQEAEDKEREQITRRQARGQRQGASQRETKRINLPKSASLEEVAFAALEQ